MHASVSRRGTKLTSALVFGVLMALLLAAATRADAPDPVPAAATVTLGPVHTVNGTPVQTVTATGRWQWPTHKADCNTDRAGVVMRFGGDEAPSAHDGVDNVRH